MKITEFITEAANPAQQAAIAIAKKKKKRVSEGSGDDFYAMALQKYPQLKRVDREIVINALNNAYEDYLMHYGYEGIGPDEESSMIDHAIKGLKQGVAEGSLNEFAVEPSDGGDDDEYDLLVKLVKMWWLGDEHQHVKAEKTLASMGISIDEDDPDIILRRGTQFLTFPMDDFQQGVAEDWNKVNHRDKTSGMSQKAVNAYRRENPGSKLKTAVTTKPSKLKKGSKAANRRKSFCARMRGMKKHRTGAKTAHDPNSNINKSLRRWHCESIEELHELVMIAEQFIHKRKNESK
jgi:hypothetical protein